MRIPGLKAARRMADWMRIRLMDSVLILGYHRVVNSLEDPYDICVQPEHFAEQLDVLNHMIRVIDLEAVQQGLLKRSLPQRAAVVTFDDGYKDILETAKPLLVERGIPATVFVVAGTLGEEFWWDTLARIILDPVTLPDELTLQIGDETFTWSMMDSQYLSFQTPALSLRHRLLHQLHLRLTAMPGEQPSVLAKLQAWAGIRPATETIARAMTSVELQSLADDGLVTIGAHSMTHPALTSIPVTDQRKEISCSRQTLESILGKPMTTFSYPHGANNATTRQLVQEVGFQLACGSQNGLVFHNSNCFALPRFWVPDWDGGKFEHWLRWWL